MSVNYTALDKKIDDYVTMGPDDYPGYSEYDQYDEEKYRANKKQYEEKSEEKEMIEENKVIEYALKYLDKRIARLGQDLSDHCYLPEETKYTDELERLIKDREEIEKMRDC